MTTTGLLAKCRGCQPHLRGPWRDPAEITRRTGHFGVNVTTMVNAGEAGQ